MSTILSLVKVKLWPAQAPVYKQQVVDRILLFAQTLFTRHANCNHLGDPGMGSFSNQVCISELVRGSSSYADPYFLHAGRQFSSRGDSRRWACGSVADYAGAGREHAAAYRVWGYCE